LLIDLVRIAEKKQFCLIWPAIVVQVKLQLLVRFVPKLRCDISDFETLTRPAFQPVKNNFDCFRLPRRNLILRT